MNLRVRLIGGTVLLITAIGIAVLLFLRVSLKAKLQGELQMRGISIAKFVADACAHPIITENIVALQFIVNNSRKVEEDIAYVFVQDQAGAVMVHTFGETFPVGLRGVNIPAAKPEPRVELLRTNEGPIYDIATPIADGDLGTVHVGLHGASVRRSLATLMGAGIGVTLACIIVFGGLALTADLLITRNLSVLSEAVGALGIGDLEHRITVTARDEFGALGRAFNAMADNIQRSEEKLVDLNTSLLREIRDRNRAQEELRLASGELARQNEELKKLDRLRDGFIRDVSHELKTPVAKHAMQLEILRNLAEREGFAAAVEPVVGVMETSVRRQQQVIRNLLGLSRLEAGVRGYRHEPVRLDEVLHGVIDDYRSLAAAKGSTFTLALAPLTILSDGEMLWHVFSNLVNNAIKFQREGGRGEIGISVAAEGAEAVVRIRDQGIGLDPEERTKVFEKFYQATASTEGSGVGLTICKMIVEGVGGRIGFESEGRGKGATAVVALPLGERDGA